MVLNSCLGGPWAWRVPRFGHRNSISSVERHRPVARPDAGARRGFGLQRPNWSDDVFQFLSGRCVGMACTTLWPSEFHLERCSSPTRCSARRRRGSRLGIKTTKLTRRCFTILVWEVRGYGMCHTLAIEFPFRALSVTDPLLGQTPAGVEAWD